MNFSKLVSLLTLVVGILTLVDSQLTEIGLTGETGYVVNAVLLILIGGLNAAIDYFKGEAEG